MRLVAGTADTGVDPAASVALNAFLKKRAWDVSLQMVPGGSHMSIVEPGPDSAWSVRAVVAAITAVHPNH